MKKNKKNRMNADADLRSSEILKHLEVTFPSSKEEAWKSIESKLDNLPAEARQSASYLRPLLPIAAAFALIFSVIVFLRYYSVDYTTNDDLIAVILPDDSHIDLGVHSQLRIYPLWWKFSRNLSLAGEARFEVAKGNRFRVSSSNGSTEVLGTIFTILASEEIYKVACYSGSVKVSDPLTDVSAILIANEKAELKKPGVFEIMLISQENANTINKNSYFTFKNQPVQSVFTILASEFDAEIELEQSIDLTYSGNLKNDLSIEEILNAVCIPLDLEYVQVSENKYIVRAKSDQ